MTELKSENAARRLWPVIGGLGAAAFVLGCIGFHSMYASELAEAVKADDALAVADRTYDWSDIVFGTMELFVFNPPPWSQVNPILNIARYLAFAATIGAGVVAVFALFSEQFLAMRLKRWSDHVVVCGLGYKGLTFVQSLRAANRRVIVIESNPANPVIEDCREAGVRIISGDAQHAPILRRAGVEKAAWLLAVCPDDAVNAEILLAAREVARTRKSGRLQCLAQISHPQLCSMLRVSQIGDDDRTWSADFFNTDDTSAALVLDAYPIVADRDKPPHILIGHLDSLGQRVIATAAQRWLSQRKQDDDTRQLPLAVTVVDDQADDKVAALKRQHAMLRDEANFPFFTSSTSAEDVSQLKDRYGDAVAPPDWAYVTSADDDQNVATALMLLYHLNLTTKVVLTLSRAHGTGKVLDSSPRIDIKVFPTFEKTCTSDLLFDVSVRRLAMEIHEIWREEQFAQVKRIDKALARLESVRDQDAAATLVAQARAVAPARPKQARSDDEAALAMIKKSLENLEKTGGDHGDALASTSSVVAALKKERADIENPPEWDDDEAAAYRESSLAQAHHIATKLRSIDSTIQPLERDEKSTFAFTEAEVEGLAIQEHDRWMAERFNAGWSVGPKEKGKKTSPYLVPFGDLPSDVAEWDRVFVRKIPQILQRAGYKAVRSPKQAVVDPAVNWSV